MKVFLGIIGAIVALIALFVVWLYYIAITKRKYPVAEFEDGNDRLTLTYNYMSNWGNECTGFSLSFNGKLVDIFDCYYEKGYNAGNSFPVRRSDREKLTVTIIDPAYAKAENFADGKMVWTVWVNPNQFSSDEYRRINEMLLKCGKQFTQAQERLSAQLVNDIMTRWDMLHKYSLTIWRTVYFDYKQLTDEVFERRKGNRYERIQVNPWGAVFFHLESPDHMAGYGCGLGRLNDGGDTLTVNSDWRYFDEGFPVSEFIEFRDIQGRVLTEVYHIEEEEEKPKQSP
jgi:hypothetical protein